MAADINIEKITLRLPDGFQQRAKNISSLIAGHLSEMSFSKSHDVAGMRLPTLHVNQGESDSAIAQRVSKAIVGQLENNTHTSSPHVNPHRSTSAQTNESGVNNA